MEKRGQTSEQLKKRTFQMVLDGQCIRETAKALDISKSTLHRYVANDKTTIVDDIQFKQNNKTESDL